MFSFLPGFFPASLCSLVFRQHMYKLQCSSSEDCQAAVEKQLKTAQFAKHLRLKDWT